MSQLLQPLPDNLGGDPTPQDFGLPPIPTAQQLNAWYNQERFLNALAKHGRICDAADAVGITVWAAERWDTADLYGYKKRKAMALLRFNEKLDAEIDRRAITGIDKPVYWRGQQVGTITEYSDNLLMFRKKGVDPRYKDNYDPRPVQQQVQITRIIIHGVESAAVQVSTSPELGAGRVVEGQVVNEKASLSTVLDNERRKEEAK